MQSAVTKLLYNSDDVVEWAIQQRGVVDNGRLGFNNNFVDSKNKNLLHVYRVLAICFNHDHGGVMVFYDYIRSQ